jgi:adenine-specific DNA-methyltransferase
MELIELKPKKALNKAFLKVKPNRTDIEGFKTNLIALLDRTNETESEEFHKNIITDFLKKTYYDPNHYINTKGRNDLVIHTGNDAKSSVGVIIETKKLTNKSEMLKAVADADTPEQKLAKINVKAFQELVLYYLRERITLKNLEIKHLIATNSNEWFIFDATIFDRLFAQNKALVKQFTEFEGNRLADTKTDFFYKQIAEPFITDLKTTIEYTYFNFQDYKKPLLNTDKTDDTALISLFKLLSPEHLLKLPFTNDSNSLDKRFYTELLHIIGLTETKDGGKKLIERHKKGERNTGSIIEDAIIQLDSLDKINRLDKPSQYGNTVDERLFNVGLELSITWINRILFLKLLEAQLITYHKGDMSYTFLNHDKIRDFDDLNSLFFQVLARKNEDRNEDVKNIFVKVPYLNSSLFEPTELEQLTLFISNLRDEKTIPVLATTVLKNEQGKKRTGNLSTLTYLFDFLNAYDFASEGSEEIQEDNKSLINASVLGLIFEKINGYKDGSFFTPGFITMYMCRETIRKAFVQKVNDRMIASGHQNWQKLETVTDVYNIIGNGIGKDSINEVINSLKICDPAVGSGHFLVSALNELIALKSDLRVLQDKDRKLLRDYHVEVLNDELIVTDHDGELYEYNPANKESQRIQETLFHEKQTLIENCLFGVDINPNSVKICRLRLWIELLKNAYYKNPTELETLPNIDINIKCGNSLVSRFAIDADLSQALKKSKWNIDSYKIAVDTYRNAESKEQKREMEKLIADIKTDFRSEIAKNDPKLNKLRKQTGDLFNLMQPGLFEMGKKEKAAWKKLVVKLTEENKKLETEIEEIRANKIYENAFEWRFEFPEVLNDEGDFLGFDVLIGNPPYIDSKKLSEISSLLKSNFEVYFSSSDLSSYFFELGLNILKSNGYISYINTNKFFRTEYGKPLRRLISNNKIHSIVNFEQVPIFDEALVSSLIIIFEKNSTKEDFYFCEFNKEESPFLDFNFQINSKKRLVLHNLLNESAWAFNSTNVSNLISKIYNGKVKIKNIETIDIKRGVTTGFDPAFIISHEISSNIANDLIIKPLLKGAHIKKYFTTNSGLNLIFTKRGYDIESDSLIKAHLFSFFEELKPKKVNDTKGRKPGDYKWYEIQDNVAYYKNFEKEKIIWALTADKWGFTIDKNKNYLSSGGFMLVSNNLDLNYLLGILNSKLMKFLFHQIGVMTAGGAYTLKKATIEEFPIIINLTSFQNSIIEIVSEIIKIKNKNFDENCTNLEVQLDKLVYELYDLNEEEIAIVEGEVK